MDQNSPEGGMLGRRRLLAFRALFGLVFAISLLVLFTPASGVPTAPPGTDKIIHLALFVGLTITGRLAESSPFPLLIALAGYAGLSEALQEFLPLGRSGGISDVLVDLLGIAAGWVVFVATRRGLRPRRSNES